MKQCARCGAVTQDNRQQICQNCGQQFIAPAYQQQPVQNSYQQVNPTYPMYGAQPDFANSVNVQPEPPMKWYKWMIYAMLFLSAIYNLFTAYLYFSGNYYPYKMTEATGITFTQNEETSFIEGVYELNDGIKTQDMLLGVAAVAVAAFTIYLRQLLAKRKSNAPTMVTIFYVATLALTVFEFLVHSKFSTPLVTKGLIGYSGYKIEASSLVISAATSVALILLNKKYYDKRKHLFCN